MNKEYFNLEGKSFITDEYENIKERKESKNIKKILEKENTMELLNKEISHIVSTIINKKRKIQILSLLSIPLSILIILFTNIIILQILAITMVNYPVIVELIDIIKNKIIINEIKKELVIQERELEHLNKTDEYITSKLDKEQFAPKNNIISGYREYADAMLTIKTRKRIK